MIADNQDVSLAAPRIKRKWSSNPRGNAWADDSSKFGQKMLEKFGWAKGKGLGANESGITEHVRASTKQDMFGLGAKDTDGDVTWASDFSAVLAGLATHADNPEGGVVEEEVPFKMVSNHRYKRIAKGKDLSRASKSDIRSVFVERAPQSLSTISTTPIEVAHNEIVQTMSVGAYFKAKMAERKLPISKLYAIPSFEDALSDIPSYKEAQATVLLANPEGETARMERKRLRREKRVQDAAEEVEAREKMERKRLRKEKRKSALELVAAS